MVLSDTLIKYAFTYTYKDTSYRSEIFTFICYEIFLIVIINALSSQNWNFLLLVSSYWVVILGFLFLIKIQTIFSNFSQQQQFFLNSNSLGKFLKSRPDLFLGPAEGTNFSNTAKNCIFQFKKFIFLMDPIYYCFISSGHGLEDFYFEFQVEEPSILAICQQSWITQFSYHISKPLLYFPWDGQKAFLGQIFASLLKTTGSISCKFSLHIHNKKKKKVKRHIFSMVETSTKQQLVSYINLLNAFFSFHFLDSLAWYNKS